MAAAIMRGAHHIEYGQIDKPQPKPGEVLIRVQANSVCGSDLHYWHEGKIGSAVVDAAFTPGHEFAGVVAEGTGEPYGLSDGTLVAVDPAQPCGHCFWCHEGNHHLCPNMIFVGAPPYPGAMAEYISVPVSTVFAMPEGFTAAQAALLEPLGVAMHALDLAKLRPGTHLTILGAGTIGLYVLMLARISGALTLSVIDPLEYRREKALELGATAVFADVPSYLASVRNTPTRGADVVIEATTSPLGPRHATEAVRIGGKVVLVGIPGRRRVHADRLAGAPQGADHQALAADGQHLSQGHRVCAQRAHRRERHRDPHAAALAGAPGLRDAGRLQRSGHQGGAGAAPSLKAPTPQCPQRRN